MIRGGEGGKPDRDRNRICHGLARRIQDWTEKGHTKGINIEEKLDTSKSYRENLRSGIKKQCPPCLPAEPFYILSFLYTPTYKQKLKGTVQRKLTGVESDIN